MKKAFKIPKSLKILSIIILSLMFIWAFFFGWGWFVPYALQPSYWEFKKLCKLNELPNNEEKYNKILAYYKISIDDVDWKKVNENKQFLCKKIRKDWRFDYVDDYEFGDCLPNVREYRKVNVVERQINYRLDTGGKIL